MSQIKEYTLQNGTKVTAYVPDNVSDDTPIFFYSYIVGSDYGTDPVWRGMEEDMLRYNGDAIVVIPHDKQLQIGTGNVATHKYQRLAIETYETIQADLGINTTQFINGGFSAGFGYATRTLAHYLQENPNSERQVLLAVDGVVKDNVNLQQSELDALRDNGTIIISFTQQKNHDHQYETFESTGLPILYLVDESIPEETPDSLYWGIHDKVAMDYFDKGFYEQLINFALGKGDIELPEGYHLRYYDPTTGEIRKVTPEEAAQLMNISATSSGLTQKTQLALASLGEITIQSEDKTLETHINSIRKEIAKSSFLRINFNAASFLSTTKIPVEIPTAINDYFSMTASLLNSIASKTISIAKIAGEIEILDNKLANDAFDLNSAEPLYTTAEALPDEGLQDLTTTNPTLESEPSSSSPVADSAADVGATNQSPTSPSAGYSNASPSSTTNPNYGYNNSSPSSSNSNGSNYYPNQPVTPQTSPQTQPATQPQTQPTTQPQTQPQTQPTTQPQTQPQTQPATQPSTTAPETEPATEATTESSTETTTEATTEATTETTTEVATEVVTTPEEIPIEENFKEYEEIYTNEEQLVYNYNDEYKVIVHHDGENVTAVEHYYDFETNEAAVEAVEKLQTEYENVENFDRIIQNDRYVKVLFKDEMYNETTIDEVKEQYIDLEEVVEPQENTTEPNEIAEYDEELEEI